MKSSTRKNGRMTNYLFDDTDVLVCNLSEFSREYMDSAEVKEKLEQLNSIVGKLGVSIRFDRGALNILWSEKEAKEKQSRYAGRPRGSKVTIGQVQEAVAATDTLEEAAAKLGISRRTLYRRLKEIREQHPDNDSVMEHYDDVL